MVLAVAKALRRVTEGKASAQAEAAEWKRKFELATAHNLQLEKKGYFSAAHSSSFCLISNCWSYIIWSSSPDTDADTLFVILSVMEPGML